MKSCVELHDHPSFAFLIKSGLFANVRKHLFTSRMIIPGAWQAMQCCRSGDLFCDIASRLQTLTNNAA